MIVKMVLITNFSFRFFQASFCYARVKGGCMCDERGDREYREELYLFKQFRH